MSKNTFIISIIGITVFTVIINSLMLSHYFPLAEKLLNYIVISIGAATYGYAIGYFKRNKEIIEKQNVEKNDENWSDGHISPVQPPIGKRWNNNFRG